MIPQDYEYLWTDYDVDFIFTSCYLFKEFRQSDIILIYDSISKGLIFFLSKQDKKKYSRQGVDVHTKGFSKWKQRIKKNISKGRRLIDQTREENTSSLSLREIKQKFRERVELFQELGGSYFYTEFFFMNEVSKLKEVKNNLEELASIKYDAREVLNSFYNYKIIFKPYVDIVAKKFNRKDLRWLSFQEIIEIIEIIEGKNIPKSNRDKVDWVLAKKTNWQLTEDKELIENFKNYFFNKKKDVVKGVIANKGIVKGTVKVLKTIFSDEISKELKKVEKGDVLVANTTGPEVMIACQKASAIVTDEGGLTSHAAIVSRELKIPCIVGTKEATIVFKDGDLVEVDADNGIVKKLS
jgi:phosphohistidine swiveling domain-containing protein